MVEGAALEMLFRGNSNEGSNPSLSVQKLVILFEGLGSVETLKQT